MAYGIGLDIGIASVGWAVVDLDYDENPMGIIRMGSRIFDAAENPKDGSPLAQSRREARSARRRLRRHRHRLERIKNLFIQEKLIDENGLNNLFNGKLKDIYQLRTEALDKLLTDEEMVRVLIHIAQRRGFMSNKKKPKKEELEDLEKLEGKEKEKGKLLGAMWENKDRMAKHGYRTVGEMFYKNATFAEHKRNKGSDYLATVGRADIEEEVKKIFAAQYALGNKKYDENLMDKYLKIVLSQRSFEEGPGGNSPYGGNQIEKMIGICTFINKRNGYKTNEPRAPKASFSFEYFDMLQKLNHMRLINGGQEINLDDEQRGKIVKLAMAKEKLTYASIRKELGLENKKDKDKDKEWLFASVNYSDKNFSSFEKKQIFDYSKIDELLYLKIGEEISPLSEEQKEKISAFVKQAKAQINYGQIRKELKLSKDILFDNLEYPKMDIEEVEKKKELKFMAFYHKVRKALDKGVAKGRIGAYTPEQLDEIGRIITIYKSGEDERYKDAEDKTGNTYKTVNKRKEALLMAGIPALDVECLLDLSSAKFGHLSLKALRNIIPFMEKGSIYNEACTLAGYNFRGHNNEEKQMYLPAKTEDMEAITSPVARRAIAQTIKVINAIIREQGESPLYINVELAREMAKDFDERKKIEKSYESNRENNEELMEELKTTYGISEPTGQDLIKLKLFREQDGISPYLQK